MNNEILNLEPKHLWNNFREICQIPHPSKKEAKLVEFVINFGKNLGLETETDEVGNIVIRKPATKGMENRKTVTLQSHLDMVPQKNSDVDHDFATDPIQTYIDGDWVTAKGTTLGADNGIGVAAILSVLQAKDLEHGAIEGFFTIDEETGMTGAFGLKGDFLKGDIMLNLDSEDEGELYIGCAGGIDTNVKFTYTEEAVPADATAYKLSLTGLKGGHSGMDIPLGRGNSVKMMNRFLWHASKTHNLLLANVDCGSLRNAIPREGFATVVVPNTKAAEFEACVAKHEETFKNEFSSVEPELGFKAKKTELPTSLINFDTQERLFKSIYGCPNGVMRMSNDMEGLVETSTNLAILKSENGEINIATLQRSSVETAKDSLCNMIRCVFELAGAEVEHDGAYPGWKPNVNSPILSTMKEVYNTKYGKVPEIKAIHAGLECGLIGAVYPAMDLISFGPTIRFPHSPDEKVHIASVDKFWNYLAETLKNIPAK